MPAEVLIGLCSLAAILTLLVSAALIIAKPKGYRRKAIVLVIASSILGAIAMVGLHNWAEAMRQTARMKEAHSLQPVTQPSTQNVIE